MTDLTLTDILAAGGAKRLDASGLNNVLITVPGAVAPKQGDKLAFVNADGSTFLKPAQTAVYSRGWKRPVPSWLGWTPTFNIYQTPGGFYTDLVPEDAIITPAKIYFVDPNNGNDANSGASMQAALKTVNAALLKSDVDQIILKPGIYHGGWAGAAVTRSVSIRVENGGRAIWIRSSLGTWPTWTPYSGAAYTTPISSGVDNTCAPLDLSRRTGYAYPDRTVYFYERMTNVANAATVVTTPGSYFIDTGTNTLYVQASDSRNLVGDQFMTQPSKNAAMQFTLTSSLTFYLENIDMIGSRPFFPTNVTVGARPVFWFVNCTFQGSYQHGLEWSGAYDGYLINCGWGHNTGDGDNISPVTSGDCRILELNCYSGRNGYTTSLSNNASTGHGLAANNGVSRIISIGCDLGFGQNRNVHDIEDTKRWSLGGTYGPSLATDATGQTVAVSGANGIHALDGVTIRKGTSQPWDLFTDAGGANIRYTNMSIAGLTLGGVANVTAYTANAPG